MQVDYYRAFSSGLHRTLQFSWGRLPVLSPFRVCPAAESRTHSASFASILHRLTCKVTSCRLCGMGWDHCPWSGDWIYPQTTCQDSAIAKWQSSGRCYYTGWSVDHSHGLREDTHQHINGFHSRHHAQDGQPEFVIVGIALVAEIPHRSFCNASKVPVWQAPLASFFHRPFKPGGFLVICQRCQWTPALPCTELAIYFLVDDLSIVLPLLIVQSDSPHKAACTLDAMSERCNCYGRRSPYLGLVWRNLGIGLVVPGAPWSGMYTRQAEVGAFVITSRFWMVSKARTKRVSWIPLDMVLLIWSMYRSSISLRTNGRLWLSLDWIPVMELVLGVSSSVAAPLVWSLAAILEDQEGLHVKYIRESKCLNWSRVELKLEW